MMLVALDRWDVKRLAKQAPGAMDQLKALVEARTS